MRCADRSYEILARSAELRRKMKAEIIYTWNIAHFLRLGEEVAERVRTP
jgi:hypothetical protein